MNTEARPIVEATGVPLAGVTITAAHLAAVIIQGLAAEAITPTPGLLIVVRLMAAGMVSPRIAVRLMGLATMPVVVMVALVAANRGIAAIAPALAARIMAPHTMRSRVEDTAEVSAVTVLAIRDAATDARRSAVGSDTTDAATRPRDIAVMVVDTAIRATLARATVIRDSAVAVISTAVGATVPASSAGMHAAISPTTIA